MMFERVTYYANASYEGKSLTDDMLLHFIKNLYQKGLITANIVFDEEQSKQLIRLETAIVRDEVKKKYS